MGKRFGDYPPCALKHDKLFSMKTIYTFSIALFTVGFSLAQSPRETNPPASTPLPTGSVPVLRFPVGLVQQHDETATPDYDQLVATADYLFYQKRYSDAIAQYEKARVQRTDEYTYDQLIRAKALMAKAEKERALEAELFKEREAQRIPQNQFVQRTLTQNNWQKIAVVCDVTGSMNEYNDQLVEWIQVRLSARDTNIQRVILFNDNDNRRKNITDPAVASGLYSFVPESGEQIKAEIRTARKESSGGDVQENNITALLRAQMDCPSCESLVMINDNNEPWDIAEASKVTKPVHIIVCGPSAALEESFLNLARSTKGSVHFNGLSYTNLADYKEGETLQVERTNYTVQSGKFRRVN